MDREEREEVREMIHGMLDGWQEATIQRENLIHQSLNSIDKHLEKQNGTIGEHSKEIEDLKIKNGLHIVECPAMPQIKELNNQMKDIEKDILGKWLRKHWRLALLLFFLMTLVTDGINDFIGFKAVISFIISKLK